MKNALLSLLLVSATTLAWSQEAHTLMFHFGVGTYRMTTQKQLQTDFETDSPILNKVHEFPPYMTFGGSLGIRLSDRSAFGIWLEHCSTGGRLTYKDYSGYATIDQVLSAYQVGPYFQMHVGKSQVWPFYFTMHLSFSSTKETVSSEVAIGSDSEVESYELKARNFGLRPGVMMKRTVGVFVFQGSLGYEIQSHGELRSTDGNDLRFVTSDGKDVNAEWDGLRLNVGVGVKLAKPKE